MRRSKTLLTSVVLGAMLLLVGACADESDDASGRSAPMVNVEPVENSQRVDVMIDGELFTSYIFPESLAVLKKPVLYPIKTADGTSITRHYPLEAKAGERADHPHHIGLWLNYGDVNGLDYWNNSDALSPERAARAGAIVHEEVVETESGAGTGALEVEADWVNPDGQKLLDEHTRYEFHARPDFRAIDRITTLQATDQGVDFPDNKEGMLGLRVRRELEMPTDNPITITDASGQAMEEQVKDNEGVTGHYRNSEGISGYPDVWGKRAKWTALSGVVEGDSVTVAIFDHPENVGYPTYWHARDYGLFAANPLGQEALSGGEEELDFSLQPNESVTFRHRVVVFSGAPDDQAIEEAYQSFVN